MAASSETVRAASATEHPRHPGWEKLVPLLAPVVVNAPQDKNAWKKLEPKVVTYLLRSVARFPWLNHLALAGVLCSESGIAHPLRVLMDVHCFLRWAIPDHYPDLASLRPVEALITYFGDPPQPRGSNGVKGYNSCQLHLHHYLESFPEKRTSLAPFLLPTLVVTPPLTKLRTYVAEKGQAKRKEQAYAVVHDLHALVARGRARYQWLADLDRQVQDVAELVKRGTLTLPTMIQCRGLDRPEALTFRIWDRKCWIKAHWEQYAESARSQSNSTRAKRSDGALFLQLLGPLPDLPWFLRAVEIGALGRTPAGRTYMAEHRAAIFGQAGQGLISELRMVRVLQHARKAAKGGPEDSRVLFCVEPLLAAAALGLCALVCLTQSGMRMGEFQQITGDHECVEIRRLPKICDTPAGVTLGSQEQVFWRLYPKGKEGREPYPVTFYMLEALNVWIKTHARFCGSFQEVPADTHQFTHARRFTGKHKFVLQWKGKHLTAGAIEMCLDFLLLEHTCLDSNGQRIRLTAHVLRHGVAGYLRNQGIPLEDIAQLLHQVNVAVTAYYSQPSAQELYNRIGPALTRLGELAEIDPATLRLPEDLHALIQAALKRFGLLCHLPGGSCCSFQSCEVQFKCAACASFVPDPTRRADVENKIAFCQKAIQWCEAEGDYFQARNQRSHLHSWERILKEMEALAVVGQLATPPFNEVLKELGVYPPSDEMLELLKQPPKQLPEGNGHD